MPAPRPRLSVRHILCPIDFSTFSRRAMEEAVPLAQAFGADITALFVYPLEPSQNAEEGKAVIPDEGARSVVAADLAPFLAPARAAGIKVEVRQRAGDPVAEILDEAGRIDAGLIAMGTHGRSRLQRLVLGSVAEAVLRRAPCPVLTVSNSDARRHGTAGSFGGVLCAVDLTPRSEGTLAVAFDIAAALGAPVTLVHVVRPSGNDATWWARRGEARERLCEAAARLSRGVLRDETILEGHAPAEIVRLAEERRSSVVVVGTRSPDAVERALCASTADQVIREARCPVIAVRGASDADGAPAETVAAAHEA
jgi:nucleotide-binding universal stress UspA family protein